MSIVSSLISIIMLSAIFFDGKNSNFEKNGCESKETGYVKVKSHPICVENYDNENKNTFQVHFTAGQRYKLNLCDANPEGEKMLVFLTDNKDRELTSNFTGNKTGLQKSLTFNCKTTGTYYLHFGFQNKAHGCGIAQLFVGIPSYSVN